MARKEVAAAVAIATKDNGGATLPVLASSDELAGLIDGLELASDGLEEIDNEDIKIPVKVFNMKGVDEASEPIPPNVFYDTIEQTTKKRLRLALLTLHKANEWREYDEGEGRSKIRCRSFDRVTGTMEDGTVRPCKGCPDAQWRTDDNGKRTRRCGPVYSFVAIDRETQQPCMLRFKRTSLGPIQDYLNRHFLGRRILSGGKRAHYPLFAFETIASLKMSDDKKYAIPVLERGEVLPREEIGAHAANAQVFRESIMPIIQKLSDQDQGDADASRSAPNTSFDPKDFQDTDASASNRF